MFESFQFFFISARMKNRRMEKKKTINVGADPKTMQHIFLDNKSIQTAAESSILLALFASELSTEIQFKTPDSIQ